MKTVIGLVAHKNSGKTTLMNAFKTMEESEVEHVGFADPIYDMIHALGIPYSDIADKIIREKSNELLGGKSIRQTMQTIGTEWGRDMISDSLWTDVAKEKITSSSSNFVIIDNVRFPNEIGLVKSFESNVLVNIHMEGLDNDDDHESEQYIPELIKQCDFTIENSLDIPIAEIVENFSDKLYEYLYGKSVI